MANQDKELPAGCDNCQSTLPCEETCGANPFTREQQSAQKPAANIVGNKDMFNGKFLTDMTKEELIDVITFMNRDRVAKQIQAEKDIGFLCG